MPNMKFDIEQSLDIDSMPNLAPWDRLVLLCTSVHRKRHMKQAMSSGTTPARLSTQNHHYPKVSLAACLSQVSTYHHRNPKTGGFRFCKREGIVGGCAGFVGHFPTTPLAKMEVNDDSSLIPNDWQKEQQQSVRWLGLHITHTGRIVPGSMSAELLPRGSKVWWLRPTLASPQKTRVRPRASDSLPV